MMMKIVLNFSLMAPYALPLVETASRIIIRLITFNDDRMYTAHHVVLTVNPRTEVFNFQGT